MTTDLHPRLQALQRQLSPSPLMPIIDSALTAYGVELWIKRDDLLHPIISGNKWRKLKYILNHALFEGADSIVSMGGAYSNHLHALAYVGQLLGLKTAAYVRGECPAQPSETLIDLMSWNMALTFVSRSDYRALRRYKDHDSLPDRLQGAYWLPEGGATELALQGVGELLSEVESDFDVMMVACGTGTTLAGLIRAAAPTCQLIGVAALKGGGFLVDDVQALLGLSAMPAASSWQILQDYHAGGFAKTTPALNQFIVDFRHRHGIALDTVYTGKLLYAAYDLIKQGYFSVGQRILLMHTGGLQGNRGRF